ncbi:MAG: hypothetical protein IPN92_09100 [Chromatiaceae bacterium]|nr:hypothetical protein [Chromatiaceae bacterium]
MPIEIRELVIRVTVDPASDKSGKSACGAGSAEPSGSAGASGGKPSAEGDVVQTCVREVLRILADRQER